MYCFQHPFDKVMVVLSCLLCSLSAVLCILLGNLSYICCDLLDLSYFFFDLPDEVFMLHPLSFYALLELLRLLGMDGDSEFQGAYCSTFV